MNTLTRNIIVGIGIILLITAVWYFSWIVSYILVSAVLSIVGHPLVDLLNRIHIKRFKFPRWLAALVTLIAIWFLFFGFIRTFIPLIFNQVAVISSIDVNEFVTKLQEPISKIETMYNNYAVAQDKSLQETIINKLSKYLNADSISGIFGGITGFFGNIFVAFFSISFMTFFFLKEQALFKSGLMIFVPDKYVDKVKHAMLSVKNLLTRYFIGILLEVSFIIILDTIGLTIVGIKFEQALVFGLIAGVLNVIPYIGPFAGTVIGLFLGLITHLHLDFTGQLLPLLMFMAIVYIIVQVLDNVIFQPIIYSSSVNAHPMEIFLVIMMAGSLAGVAGMILAVPAYTILRVFAKEFFANFKLVKKLTEKI